DLCHERKGERKKRGIERQRKRGEKGSAAPTLQLAEGQINGPAAQDREYHGGAAKDDKGKTRDTREQRAPQDLRDWIERADLEYLKPPRFEQMLDAPGINPIVDHGNVDPGSNQQPTGGKYRTDGE